MPKRSHSDKIRFYQEKIRKLKEKDKPRSRRRVIIYSDSDDEGEGLDLVETVNLEVNDIDPLVTNTDQPIQDISKEIEPEIDTEFLTALGDPVDEKQVYGAKIHQNLADRWLSILRQGLKKEAKDQLIKELTIPENCKLLRAPTLNPEISAAISDSTRARDKKFEAAQQQLGLGISSINRALTILVSGVEDKDTKIKIIKQLSDSCRILSDLHFLETQARKKAITPALEKSFLHVVENIERDEFLFGNSLPENIKASKAIERQSLQIKKTVTPQKSTLPVSQSTRPRYQGNWSNPSRHQPLNRGGRGGTMRAYPSTRRSAPVAAAMTKTSQSKQGARRN